MQQVADAAALAAAARKYNKGESSTVSFAAQAKIASNYLAQGMPDIGDLEMLGDPIITVGPNTVDVTINGRTKGTFLNILNAIPAVNANFSSSDSFAGDEADSAFDFDFTVSTKAGYLRESYICLLARPIISGVPKTRAAICGRLSKVIHFAGRLDDLLSSLYILARFSSQSKKPWSSIPGLSKMPRTGSARWSRPRARPPRW